MNMSILQSTGTVPTSAVTNTSLLAAQSLGNSTARFSLSSYPRELLALPLRGLYQAETLAFSTIPRQIAGMATYLWRSGPATGPGSDAVAATTQAVAGAAQDGMADAADSGLHFADFFQAVVKFSGLFSYLTSRWSLACFTVGLVLNRITIYASTRRHLNLDWHRRLSLRIIPIVLFITQIFTLLRAMRCQSSPDYPLMRYGTPGKRLSLDHAGGGGFLYSLASTLIPWEADDQSCSAVHMSRSVNSTDIPYGSFRFLWPVFLRLCLSHFVETLSCALQGRVVVTEAGMSIFEHSLAFAEAESTISQSLGLGLFGLPKANISKADSGASSQSALHLLTRAQVLERMNVTPELLLIALISCCNSLTSNILDVFGKQSRYRLLNTGFWGFCYMSAMAWGLMSGGSAGAEDLVLKFPTVCIVGFVPHLLILLGIIMCGVIYGVALFITALSLPTDGSEPLSVRQRLALAHENMQGSTQMHSIRLNRHDDFYTTLLRIGYTVLTAASEAVFLNEGQGVVARNMTWLEDERLSELESLRKTHPSRPSHDNTTGMALEGQDAIEFAIPEAPSEWESGYGKERKIEKPKHGTRPARSQIDPGVGALRSAARYYHGFSFFRSIFYLLLRWIAYGLDKLLSKCGISRRPQWLKTILGARVRGPQEAVRARRGESLDFWILDDDGGLELPSNHEFDVETEMRKRERLSLADWEQSDERRLDEKLYNWWKAGGSWGDQDQTPDFAPPSDDWDDTTSVVSMSTTTDSEWEDESDWRRTPTQQDPYPGRFSRESTPPQEPLMDISSFARLLDPRDQESRQEARILAAHLAAGQDGRIMTRRQYQAQVERDRAKVLLSRVQSQRSGRDKRKPTPEEESEQLEKLILSRRSEPAASSASASHEQTWESGASGLGPSGPPCVVCQTSPRSIITWPCRCLCVCEDCRVSLAMNNFGSCVTCRQEVGGFVRLWVP